MLLPALLQMAGLEYNSIFNTQGFLLVFGGFGDKMPDFIAKIAETVVTHTPTDSVEFERLRDLVGFHFFPRRHRADTGVVRHRVGSGCGRVRVRIQSRFFLFFILLFII